MSHFILSSFFRRVVVNFFKFITTLFYKVRLSGLDNIKLTDCKGLLIICNHLSYFEPPLIAMFLPVKDIMFAINPEVASRWWVKPFLRIVPAVSVDTNSSVFLKILIQKLKEGTNIVIFPEGRTSTTGSLMKIYLGAAMIGLKAQSSILPVHITGTEKTFFSRLKKITHYRNKFLRTDINIHLGKIFQLRKLNLNSKEKIRNSLLSQLHHAMTLANIESKPNSVNLFDVLLRIFYESNPNRKILGDANKMTSYRNLIYCSICYKKFIFDSHPLKVDNKIIAVLLENSLELIYSLFAISLNGSDKLILHPKTDPSSIISSCKKLNITLLVTSRKFLISNKLDGLSSILSITDIHVLYIEDVQFNRLTRILHNIYNSFFAYSNCFIQSNFIFLNADNDYESFSDQKILSNIMTFSSQIDIRYNDVFLSHRSCSTIDGIILALLPLLNNKVGYIISDNNLPFLEKKITSFIYLKNVTIFFTHRTIFQNALNYLTAYDFFILRLVVINYCDHYYNFKDYFYSKFRETLKIKAYLKINFSGILATDDYLYQHDSDLFSLITSAQSSKITTFADLQTNPEYFADMILKEDIWLNFAQYNDRIFCHWFQREFIFEEGFLSNNSRKLFKRIYGSEDLVLVAIYYFLLNHTNLEFKIFKKIDKKKQFVTYTISLMYNEQVKFVQDELNKIIRSFGNVHESFDIKISTSH